MRQMVQLRVINPKREGMSLSTGQAWRGQDVVVAWTDKHDDGELVENVMSVTLRNEQQELFEQRGYKVGDTLAMEFQFYTYMKGAYVNNGVNVRI